MGFQHVMPWNVLNNAIPLILLIDTGNPGVTAADTIRIPLVGTANIDWGDGNITFGASGTTDHTYALRDQYVVKISATADSIFYNNTSDDTKLLEIQQWGTMGWTTMASSFHGCSNMTITATDLPDLSGATDMSSTFNGCKFSTMPLFDTSNITNMSSCWRNMDPLVNFPLLDTSNVTNFNNAWQELNNITSFPLIDTSSGLTFVDTFRRWISFSGNDFPTIDLSSMTNGTNMFAQTTISEQSWSDLLVATEASTIINNVTWSGGSAIFNAEGSVARASLTDDHTWTITDGATADIVEVTTGEVTFPTTGAVLNVTVPELTMNRTLLYFTYKDEDTDTLGEDAECRIRGQITSSTNIQFNVDTTPAFEKTIKYTLVHYSAISPVVIERGSEIAMSGTADNITIPAVTLANTFPIISVSTNAGNFNSAGLVRGRLSSTTNIAITAGVNRSQDIDWQTCDHPDYDVTEETITIADTTVQATTTVTAFVQADVWLVGSMDYDISSIQADDMAVWYHISTTQIRGRRTASNDVCTMTIYMVDGNGGFVVDSARSHISNTNSAQNSTISAVTIANSLPYFSGANGGMGDQNTGTPVATPEDSQMLVKFNSTTQIRLERVGTSEDVRFAVQAVDFTPSF